MDQRRRSPPKHRPRSGAVELAALIETNRKTLSGVPRTFGRSRDEIIRLVALDRGDLKNAFFRFEKFDPNAPFFSHVNTLAARVVQAELAKGARETVQKVAPLIQAKAQAELRRRDNAGKANP